MDFDASENLPSAPFFAELTLWQDDVPHDGAWNMAADEWLLQNIACPLLRVYRWKEPTVSFGYFQAWEEAASLLPAGDPRPLVRRWTGGGLVEHGDDWTYSLIVPYAEPFCRVSPKASYALIHSVLAKVLQQNDGLSLFSFSPPPAIAQGGGACFQRPVAADVVDAEGRKIAGAAQRRGKAGLLHQGSAWIPANFLQTDSLGKRLAAALALRVTPWKSLLSAENEQIGVVARERYASDEWLKKR